MSTTTEKHIFRRFDKEMQQLHALVMEMGTLAVNQLNDALKTLEEENPKAAHAVIKNDQKLNQLDIKADEEIIQLIAKRQPMARDLREIIVVGKIVAELERAGDEARKIAGLTIRFFQESARAPDAKILEDIFTLAEYVSEMLELSLKSFDELNLNTSYKVLKKEVKLDSKLQSILRRLSTFIMEDSRNVGHFVDIVLGIRALERFGGHAKNIAGHIVFLKNNIDVRHAGIESILDEIKSTKS